jgi:hypothetical protein
MVVTLIVISLLRGKGDGKLAGVHKCSATDWFLFFLLISIAITLTIVAVIILKKEYREK